MKLLHKHILFSPPLLVLFSFLLSGMGGCKHKDNTQQVAPPVVVTVETVHPQSVQYYNEYPGLITAYDQVSIYSQVTGHVTGSFVGDGEYVKKGQLLYTIDNEQFKAQYEQAQANLEADIANYEKALKDVERYQYLMDNDAIATQTYDYAIATLEDARMQVKAAEEDVINQSAYLRYATIRSPLEGYMHFSNVSKGTLVTAGSTLLNVVSTIDPVLVDIYVSEKDVPDFLINMDRQVDSLFTLKLPGIHIYEGTGHIHAIGHSIDSQTGTLRVRICYPNKDRLLKNGMSCNVRMKVSDDKKQVVIPAKAITEQMSEYFVFLLNADSTVKEQKIEPIRTIGDKVIVGSGLTDGDNLIIDGIQSLKTGTKVTYTKRE